MLFSVGFKRLAPPVSLPCGLRFEERSDREMGIELLYRRRRCQGFGLAINRSNKEIKIFRIICYSFVCDRLITTRNPKNGVNGRTRTYA